MYTCIYIYIHIYAYTDAVQQVLILTRQLYFHICFVYLLHRVVGISTLSEFQMSTNSECLFATQLTM